MDDIKRALLRIRKHVMSVSNDATILAANKLMSELARETPVDTGKARDSWQLRKVAEGRVVIENKTDYIDDLNRGTSKQAPAFFIENVALRYGKPIGDIVTVKNS